MKNFSLFCEVMLLAFAGNAMQPNYIDASDNRAIAIGNDGGVYTWGSGTDIIINPIEEASEIIAVLATSSSSILLDANGDVWMFGDRNESLNEPKRKIEGLPPIHKIAAATRYLVFLDQNDCVWTLAEKDCPIKSISATPTKIEKLPEIIAVAAGEDHIVFLDWNGEVWTVGHGYQGQLGHGSIQFLHEPKKIENSVTNMPKITRVAAGENHTILLDENGEVWFFGWAARCQTGKRSYLQNTPRKIQEIGMVRAIAAGNNHSVLVDENGCVWTLGIGEFGQLGHGDQKNQKTFKKIQSVSEMLRFVDTACGAYSTFLIDDTGAVWSFGREFYGELGHNNQAAICIPKKIEDLTVRLNKQVSSIKSARK